MYIVYSGIYVLLSYLNPFFGVFFTLGIIGNKLLFNKKFNSYYINIILFSSLLLIFKIIYLADFFEIIFASFTTYAYFYWIFKKVGYNTIVVNTIFLVLLFSFIQYLLFKNYYQNIIQQSIMLIKQILIQSDKEGFLFDNLDMIRRVYLKTYISIYTVIIGFAIYLGTIFLSKKKEMKKWEHSLFELPTYFTYILIFALFFYVIPSSLFKDVGINLLIILNLVYFIQGVSVILFIFSSYFKKSKIYYIIFITLLIINNLFILVLSLIGIFDRWFDFRKLHKSNKVSFGG